VSDERCTSKVPRREEFLHPEGTAKVQREPRGRMLEGERQSSVAEASGGHRDSSLPGMPAIWISWVAKT